MNNIGSNISLTSQNAASNTNQTETTFIKITDEEMLKSIKKAEKEIESFMDIQNYEDKYRTKNIISISTIASGSGVYFVSVAHNNILGLILGLSIIATGVLMYLKSHLEYVSNKGEYDLLSDGQRLEKITEIVNTMKETVTQIESITEGKEKVQEFLKLLSNLYPKNIDCPRQLDILTDRFKKISCGVSTDLHIKKVARKLGETANTVGIKVAETAKEGMLKVAETAKEVGQHVTNLLEERKNKKKTSDRVYLSQF